MDDYIIGKDKNNHRVEDKMVYIKLKSRWMNKQNVGYMVCRIIRWYGQIEDRGGGRERPS